MARALINVPKTARRGDTIEIRAMIAHPMETGFRTGPDGGLVPRDLITRFTCTYRGEEIFAAEYFPAMTANPYVSFTLRASESGEIVFAWSGDNGFAQTEKTTIEVT